MIIEIIIIVIGIFLLTLLLAGIDIFLSGDFPSIHFKVSLFAFLLSIVILIIALKSQPKAIDVYRGKTTIEITYKDEVPIDSVVVWK